MELSIAIHEEDGSYWAEVKEMPGCFASGQTLDGLFEALTEAVMMYVDDEHTGEVTIEKQPEKPQPPMRLDEMKVSLPRRRPKRPGRSKVPA